jgi:hypothetical protein
MVLVFMHNDLSTLTGAFVLTECWAIGDYLKYSGNFCQSAVDDKQNQRIAPDLSRFDSAPASTSLSMTDVYSAFHASIPLRRKRYTRSAIPKRRESEECLLNDDLPHIELLRLLRRRQCDREESHRYQLYYKRPART